MSVNILGVEFSPVTLRDATSLLDKMLKEHSELTRIIVTANSLMVMDAQEDPEFLSILQKADLLVPDGAGILWAAKKLGYFLPERVTGVALVDYILEKDDPPSVFLLGAKPGVADKAAERIVKYHSKVHVVGTHHGYFDAISEKKVVEMVSLSKADVILVGMGSPIQEKFLWRNRAYLGARIGMGVGGVIDLLAGETQRAPQVFQKAGLEWLYRLIRQPKRFKRDLALIRFMCQVLSSRKQ